MKKIKNIKQEVYHHKCGCCPKAVLCHEECEYCEDFYDFYKDVLVDELQPVIHFTEENWKRMKEDANDVDVVQDCYGTISVGGIHADIDLFENCEKVNGEWVNHKPIAGNYTYVRGFDDGYGVDEKNGNMPYCLWNGGHFDIPLECETFEEFKEVLAKNFVSCCADLVEYGDASFMPKIPGKLVPGCTDDIEAILAGANGVWA